MHAVYLPDCSIADRRDWLYVIVAPHWKALYIGQTTNARGVLGRLAEHLGRSGGSTFRSRLQDIHGYEDLEIGEVRLWAWHLEPSHGPFAELDYREATEFLLQNKCLNFLAETKTRLAVLSRVEGNAYTRDMRVEGEAEMAFSSASRWLQELALLTSS